MKVGQKVRIIEDGYHHYNNATGFELSGKTGTVVEVIRDEMATVKFDGLETPQGFYVTELEEAE